jgi:hypothetical protein
MRDETTPELLRFEGSSARQPRGFVPEVVSSASPKHIDPFVEFLDSILRLNQKIAQFSGCPPSREAYSAPLKTLAFAPECPRTCPCPL